MSRPDHRHIPFPLDAITGITADLAPTAFFRHGATTWSET
jgi:hypothetical protein